MIRAHEAQEAGFKFYRKTYRSDFPSLITLFSACNYCDVYRNKGAIIKYEKNALNIKQYSAVSHPYWLPNFMDVFTWSLPFIAEKLTDILLTFVNVEPMGRKEIIRTKIHTIGRLARFYKQARSKSENAVILNGLVASDFINLDSFKNLSILPDGEFIGQGLDKRKLSIEEIKELDKKNEARPDRISVHAPNASKSATQILLKPLANMTVNLKRSSSVSSVSSNKNHLSPSRKLK
jgi:serine/threonine-protein phosphatase 2B catalytic subunit